MFDCAFNQIMKSTTDLLVRNFQDKLLHRLLPSNKLLHKMK